MIRVWNFRYSHLLDNFVYFFGIFFVDIDKYFVYFMLLNIYSVLRIFFLQNNREEKEGTKIIVSQITDRPKQYKFVDGCKFNIIFYTLS